jgi:hypothetical protein
MLFSNFLAFVDSGLKGVLGLSESGYFFDRLIGKRFLFTASLYYLDIELVV